MGNNKVKKKVTIRVMVLQRVIMRAVKRLNSILLVYLPEEVIRWSSNKYLKFVIRAYCDRSCWLSSGS